MKTLKNNELSLRGHKKLYETHNGKKKKSSKVKLCMYKSRDHLKTYHPLKRKKIKLNQLSFAPGMGHNVDQAIEFLKITGSSVLSKRYCVAKEKAIPQKTAHGEDEIIRWLGSIDVEIKRIAPFKFLLKNKICSFNNVLVFANRKRVERGLPPFYIEEMMEY